jgi:hypothetical protein
VREREEENGQTAKEKMSIYAAIFLLKTRAYNSPTLLVDD